MAVLTLGEAWKLGWRVRARCLWGGPDPHSRHNRISIECDTTVRLDMETLVWTRGHKFPLDQLSSRLKRPKCGERRVQVYFEVPGEPKARTVRAAGCPSKASRRTSPVEVYERELPYLKLPSLRAPSCRPTGPERGHRSPPSTPTAKRRRRSQPASPRIWPISFG